MNVLAIKYLNRLSDLLFILARHANREQGDVLWVPGGERCSAGEAQHRCQVAEVGQGRANSRTSASTSRTAPRLSSLTPATTRRLATIRSSASALGPTTLPAAVEGEVESPAHHGERRGHEEERQPGHAASLTRIDGGSCADG